MAPGPAGGAGCPDGAATAHHPGRAPPQRLTIQPGVQGLPGQPAFAISWQRPGQPDHVIPAAAIVGANGVQRFQFGRKYPELAAAYAAWRQKPAGLATGLADELARYLESYRHEAKTLLATGGNRPGQGRRRALAAPPGMGRTDGWEVVLFEAAELKPDRLTAACAGLALNHGFASAAAAKAAAAACGWPLWAVTARSTLVRHWEPLGLSPGCAAHDAAVRATIGTAAWRADQLQRAATRFGSHSACHGGWEAKVWVDRHLQLQAQLRCGSEVRLLDLRRLVSAHGTWRRETFFAAARRASRAWQAAGVDLSEFVATAVLGWRATQARLEAVVAGQPAGARLLPETDWPELAGRLTSVLAALAGLATPAGHRPGCSGRLALAETVLRQMPGAGSAWRWRQTLQRFRAVPLACDCALLAYLERVQPCKQEQQEQPGQQGKQEHQEQPPAIKAGTSSD